LKREDCPKSPDLGEGSCVASKKKNKSCTRKEQLPGERDYKTPFEERGGLLKKSSKHRRSRGKLPIRGAGQLLVPVEGELIWRGRQTSALKSALFRKRKKRELEEKFTRTYSRKRALGLLTANARGKKRGRVRAVLEKKKTGRCFRGKRAGSCRRPYYKAEKGYSNLLQSAFTKSGTRREESCLSGKPWGVGEKSREFCGI